MKILSRFKYSHHIKIHSRAKNENRSDKQYEASMFPKDSTLTNPHKFDEVYAKGRGGNKYINRDKEGFAENFNIILNRAISPHKPEVKELNVRNVEYIEASKDKKLSKTYTRFTKDDAINRKK